MLTIGLDADDTLWHNESLYWETQEKYRDLLAPYHAPAWIDQKLYETEMRNLAHFGYGIKGFTLSMIETAIELTEGRVTGAEIAQVLGYAKAMLAAPVELLPDVAAVVETLAQRHPLLLITKGDLFDQEEKLARSGLGAHFQHVEIVRDKDAGVYAQILAKHGIAPAEFVMVGNSVRSDILPALQVGAQAVHIPYAITWAHEDGEVAATPGNGYHHLTSIRELPALVERLNGAGAAAV
jgi:putative hydrolase of the HAD superfamily